MLKNTLKSKTIRNNIIYITTVAIVLVTAVFFSYNKIADSFKVKELKKSPLELINASELVTELDNPNLNNTQDSRYIVPEEGYYEIDLYGAQGANYGSYTGGLGGHVAAVVNLKAGDILYINIGGQEGTNGGGNGSVANGGDATDIRLNGTALTNRIMIAGGGGGASQSENGGAGGLNTSLTTELGYGESATSGSGGGGGYYGGKKGEVVYHKHIGNENEGGGCYTSGYHTHVSECSQAVCNWRRLSHGVIGGVVVDCSEDHSLASLCGQGWRRNIPIKEYSDNQSYYESAGTHIVYSCGNPINRWRLNCGKDTSSIDSYGSGSGGSNFIISSAITNITNEAGVQSGNGKAVIRKLTKIKFDYNKPTNSKYEVQNNSVTEKCVNVVASTKKYIAGDLPQPTLKNYTFLGWSTIKNDSKNSSNYYSNNTNVDITNEYIQLYAQWEINKYTVTFVNEGTVVDTQTVEHGARATAPTLTKTGYTLSWDKAFNSITEDLTVNAIWTPVANTAYTVEYYKQNLALNGYDKVEADTQILTGTTDTTVTAIPKTYIGFTPKSDNVLKGIIAGDGSLVIRIYYDRNKYTVTFKNEGTVVDTQQIAYEGSATEPTPAPTKAGYTLSWNKAFNNIISDLEINAIWTANTNTPYTVEHYKQNLTLDGYDKVEADTQSLTGTTDTTVTAIPKTYIGFTPKANNVLKGIIAGDGSLVIRVYYDRNTYTVTFKNEGTVVDTQQIAYEGSATEPTPAPTKAGYTLSWDKAFNSITSDLEVNAVWTANTNTPYRIEHYKQNTLLNGYDKVTQDTQNLTGTTGEQVTAIPKTYEGFTPKESNILTSTIFGDGSLVIEVYYDRNAYQITYNQNGGNITDTDYPATYTYGIGATLPQIEKQGYNFAGWYDNSSLTGNAISQITKEDIGNKTYYAKWTAKGDTAYKVLHYKQVGLTNEYTLEEIDELTAATDEQVTAVPKAYGGYVENTQLSQRIPSGIVAADGSLELSLYYDTIKLTVEFKDGEMSAKEEVVAYGESATAPTLTKQGYVLKWDKSYTNVRTDLIVNAVWLKDTDEDGIPDIDDDDTQVRYTVKHYKQIGNTNQYQLADTDELTGNLGSIAMAMAKKYEGYIENTRISQRKASGVITVDGNLELVLFYDTIKLTVEFRNENETINEQQVVYGENAIQPTPLPTKQGYVLRWDKIFTNVKTDLIVNAVWLVDTDGDGIPDIEDDDTQVKYVVKHYKQQGNTNEYRLADTDELTGHLGSTVAAIPKTYEGYVENTSISQRIPTGIVKADGSLELILYYDYKKYEVIIKDGDEVISTQEITHGETVNPPVITKPGYILTWDKRVDNVTGEVTIIAVWTKDPNYVHPNADKEDENEKGPSIIPQTGEEIITLGAMITSLGIAILALIKYKF